MSKRCNTWSELNNNNIFSSESEDKSAAYKSKKLTIISQSPEPTRKSFESSWLLTSDSDEIRDFSKETWYDPSESPESFYQSEETSSSSMTRTMIISSMSESDTCSRDSGREYADYSNNTSRMKEKLNSTMTKRKRVATVQQRQAANIRERRRMLNLNQAFNSLRKKVPTFVYERRLSRIETLRLAILYISFMTDLLNSPNQNHSQIHSQMMENWSLICAQNDSNLFFMSQSHQN